MFRKEALDSVAYKKQEYFDELLHYKNDVDLAYRLQWAGFPCLFIPSVKVYHDRQVGGKGENIGGIVATRKEKSTWAKENSYFGHLAVLYKNFSSDFSLQVRLRTGVFNALVLVYITLFERSLLQVRKNFFASIEEMKRKKEVIQKNVMPKAIEAYME